MTASVPVAEKLFTWPSIDPRLIGSRCTACRAVTFPVQASCPSCTATEMEDEQLPNVGTLWSWTIQAFEPKPPFRPPAGGFVPYGVGYIDLGEVLVESRLTTADPGRLRIGMEMGLSTAPVYEQADGTQVVTFLFGPIGET